MSILDKLEEAEVVSIERKADGYEIMELCDYYNRCTLTPEEFDQLIAELQAMRNA